MGPGHLAHLEAAIHRDREVVFIPPSLLQHQEDPGAVSPLACVGLREYNDFSLVGGEVAAAG